MNFSAHLKEKSQIKAFLFLFITTLIIALAELFKAYVIYSGYDKPSPLAIFPTLFQYLGFSLIAFIFPHSWKVVNNSKRIRFSTVVITSLIFVLVYVFLLAFLEWVTSVREYSLWKAYQFTLLHTGLLVLFLYYVISSLYYVFILSKERNVLKKEYPDRITYKSKGITTFIPLKEVEVIESNDNYVSIYTDAGKHYLIRQTISKLERQLDPSVFQRIHRKYIVNIKKIISTEVDPNGGHFIHLPIKKNIKMSKSYKEKLKLLMAED
jgi:hypothetical protein